MSFDLKRAKDMCETATAGPWRIEQESQFDAIQVVTDARYICDLTGWDSRPDECGLDAFFIAESRTLLPAAIARIEELEAEVERMRPVMRAAVEWHDWYGSDDSESEREASEALWPAIDSLTPKAKS